MKSLLSESQSLKRMSDRQRSSNDEILEADDDARSTDGETFPQMIFNGMDTLKDSPQQELQAMIKSFEGVMDSLHGAEDCRYFEDALHTVIQKFEDCRLSFEESVVSDELKPTLALFAKSGIGKSFILNLFLQLTCVDFRSYRTAAKAALNKEGKIKGGKKILEALESNLVCANDVIMELVDVNNVQGDSRDDTSRMLKDYCEHSGKLDTSSRQFIPFLLPSFAQDSGSTTGTPIHLHYGNVFQLVVIYQPLEEIFSFFQEYLFKPQEVAGEEEGEITLSKLTKIAITMATALLSTSSVDKEEFNYENATYDDIDRKFTTNCDALVAWKSQKFCEVIEQHIGKKFLYHGNGSDLAVDLTFIRNKLQDHVSKKLRVFIKEIHIYAPCIVLQHMNIVDVPGCLDIDPLNNRDLLKIMDKATVIVAIDENAVGITPLLKEFESKYRNCAFWNNLKEDPKHFQFCWMRYKERNGDSRPIPEEILDGDDDSKINSKILGSADYEFKQKKFLLNFLRGFIGNTDQDNVNRKKRKMDESAISIEDAISCIDFYPVIFCSLMMNLNCKLNLEKSYGKEKVQKFISWTNGLQFLALTRATTKKHQLEQIRKLKGHIEDFKNNIYNVEHNSKQLEIIPVAKLTAKQEQERANICSTIQASFMKRRLNADLRLLSESILNKLQLMNSEIRDLDLIDANSLEQGVRSFNENIIDTDKIKDYITMNLGKRTNITSRLASTLDFNTFFFGDNSNAAAEIIKMLTNELATAKMKLRSALKMKLQEHLIPVIADNFKDNQQKNSVSEVLAKHFAEDMDAEQSSSKVNNAIEKYFTSKIPNDLSEATTIKNELSSIFKEIFREIISEFDKIADRGKNGKHNALPCALYCVAFWKDYGFLILQNYLNAYLNRRTKLFIETIFGRNNTGRVTKTSALCASVISGLGKIILIREANSSSKIDKMTVSPEKFLSDENRAVLDSSLGQLERIENSTNKQIDTNGLSMMMHLQRFILHDMMCNDVNLLQRLQDKNNTRRKEKTIVNFQYAKINIRKLKELMKALKVVSAKSEYVVDNNSNFVDELERTYRLKIHPIAKDGNCMFRALAHQLWSDDSDDAAWDMRQFMVRVVVLLHDETLYPIENGRTLTEWAETMSLDREWGDALILEHFTKYFGVVVDVISPSLTNAYRLGSNSNSHSRVLKLAYNGTHYDSLVPIDNQEMIVKQVSVKEKEITKKDKIVVFDTCSVLRAAEKIKNKRVFPFNEKSSNTHRPNRVCIPIVVHTELNNLRNSHAHLTRRDGEKYKNSIYKKIDDHEVPRNSFREAWKMIDTARQNYPGDVYTQDECANLANNKSIPPRAYLSNNDLNDSLIRHAAHDIANNEGKLVIFVTDDRTSLNMQNQDRYRDTIITLTYGDYEILLQNWNEECNNCITVEILRSYAQRRK